MSDLDPSVTALDGDGLGNQAREWLASVQQSIRVAAWVEADASLQLAETMLDVGLARAVGVVATELAESRALCTVFRSDIALRRWKLPEAERHLDEAYMAFKKVDGVIGAELWRVTARLAERQGRWASARAAWRKVAKVVEGKDEAALVDAWIRLAEVELIEGDPTNAERHLERLEPMVRELDSVHLRARVAVVRAAYLELAGQHQAAWEAWQDAEQMALVASPDFQGLLKLRMAETALRESGKAFDRLLDGFDLLQESHHADAMGVAYHQTSVLALEGDQPAVAALAALGAAAARDGYDDVSRPLILAALQAVGLSPDDDVENIDVVVDEAFPAAREMLGGHRLGSREALLSLVGACPALVSGAQIQLSLDEKLVTKSEVRHRATLTWDAPVGTLQKASPVFLATPPPAIRIRAPRPPVLAATAPPAPPSQPRGLMDLAAHPPQRLRGAYSGPMSLAAALALILLVFAFLAVASFAGWVWFVAMGSGLVR